jgi:hypothetical protein
VSPTCTSDSYLGAIVTDNVAQNLGIKTYLNGALVSSIVLDPTGARGYRHLLHTVVPR